MAAASATAWAHGGPLDLLNCTRPAGSPLPGPRPVRSRDSRPEGRRTNSRVEQVERALRLRYGSRYAHWTYGCTGSLIIRHAPCQYSCATV